MEQNENHASQTPLKQSLLVSVAILIAGVSIAGAIIYNGKNTVPQSRVHTLTVQILGESLADKVEKLVIEKGDVYQKEMDADKAEGTSLGVSGTPAVIVNKVLVPGAYPYDQIKPEIEYALDPSKKTSPSSTFKPADITKVDVANDPYIGDANAPITIVYWYDYQCPFCQRFELQTVNEVIKDYVETGKAKLVFKDYAFLGPDSMLLGKYSAAVWELAPDKFYAWHENIFKNQGQENSGWATASY